MQSTFALDDPHVCFCFLVDLFHTALCLFVYDIRGRSLFCFSTVTVSCVMGTSRVLPWGLHPWKSPIKKYLLARPFARGFIILSHEVKRNDKSINTSAGSNAACHSG